MVYYVFIIQKRKGSVLVETKEIQQSYISKIVDEASQIPTECQEYVLAVMHAMVFTRNVIKKESN